MSMISSIISNRFKTISSKNITNNQELKGINNQKVNEKIY